MELYKDASFPVSDRVKDLLSRMTLHDKLMQMSFLDDRAVYLKDNKFNREAFAQASQEGCIGGIQDVRLPPNQALEVANEIQDFLVNHTRLGIPAFIVGETLHGVMTPDATIYPQAIGLASTWNTDLIYEMANEIGKEAYLSGINQAAAPDLDLALDPRWGRVEETYGEDPYLATQMGVAYTMGIQGNQFPLPDGKIIATLKHFAAHGMPEGGLNLAPVSIGERRLREVFLPVFQQVIREAKPLSVMPAYSELDGIPCSANHWLLTEILRDELGFDGYTISDYNAIDMLERFHHCVEDMRGAAKAALLAGMDFEAPSRLAYLPHLENLIQSGEIQEEIVDRAVSRILSVKFRAGLFDKDYKNTSKSSPSFVPNRKLAKRIADESIVLLKNDGLLPLSEEYKRIAVIGPNADVAQLGDYCVEKTGVSLLQGIQNRVGEQTEVYYERGCGLWEPFEDGIPLAVEAAKKAQVAIVAVGGSSMMDYGIGWGQDKNHAKTCGEGFDLSSLGLCGKQEKLVQAVLQTGTPTILVHIDGRPASIPDLYDKANAVLEAWYPGEEGGNSLADIIFGKVNPSGRLPISIPKHVGQLPVYYYHKPSAKGYYHRRGTLDCPGRDYVFEDPSPCYEFGFGLSYTTFEYTNLTAHISDTNTIKIKVTVKNSGERAGKETVMVFIRDVVSSVTTPVKILKRFQKILLLPGEEKTICFELLPSELSLVGQDMKRITEPGEFIAFSGTLSCNFRL